MLITQAIFLGFSKNYPVKGSGEGARRQIIDIVLITALPPVKLLTHFFYFFFFLGFTLRLIDTILYL